MSNPLNQAQRNYLVTLAATKEHTQEELARMFGVSRWVVRTTLMEAKAKASGTGILQAVISPTDQALLDVAKATGLSPTQLHQALYIPSLTPENMLKYLTTFSQGDLAELFYKVALTQVMHHRANETTNAPPETV